VDIIASDAHNLKSRRPGLSKAWGIVETRYGKALAEELMLRKPALILRNLAITPTVCDNRAMVGSLPGRSSENAGGLGRFLKWVRNG
jgi:tyrosine-protein phosphatase YwqE